MADQPTRAIFCERQILGSADLNLAVDHERDAAARTLRSVTTSGIFEGIEFRSTDVPVIVGTETIVGKQLRITSGIARDDFGRLIVVADDVVFGTDLFEQSIGGNPDQDPGRPGVSFPYPVFLVPLDAQQISGAAPGSRCGSASGSTRVIERFEVRVGRRGEELPRQLPPIGASVGADGDGTARPLLLGFVRYHKVARCYVEVVPTLNRLGRHDSGVRAAEVVGRADRIEMRTTEKAVAGTPTMVLDRTDGGQLSFGTATATGDVDKLFWVTANGDVFAKGALHGTRTEGQIAIESGVINHGMPLPLPAGVTKKEVDDGTVVIHLTLTPMYPPIPAPPANVAYAVIECGQNNGQVACRYAEYALAPVAGVPAVIIEGSCRYQVIASVPAAGATP